ncbi:hypothetical protein [Pseudopedobacter beijingensis]|uniref:TIR domain-containing protein n=1 Tax=Pseudopedobacter beijingensis TaxID=1207056 RepID=A0ABW4IEC4_9SPHI
MYRGYNLNLNWNPKCDDDFFEAGQELFLQYEETVKKTLKSYALKEGTLDGSKMQSNWFPQVKADIFISHSHRDEKRAIALAGWLYKVFGIKSFIDSCIWGYSNELLRLIDNKYCFQESSRTYNYNSRNYSTSHVHMMLSVALTMMIDQTECIFFLNTPNSISASSIIDKTESPWIYSEIAMTQMIRKKKPRRHISGIEKLEKGGKLNESELRIQYNIDLSHLVEIDINTLIDWKKDFTKSSSPNALDKLYELTQDNDRNLILG